MFQLYIYLSNDDTGFKNKLLTMDLCLRCHVRLEIALTAIIKLFLNCSAVSCIS